ncbi:Small ribosomal subunit protein eS25x [Ranunculus cassubicifolius]
MNGLYVYSPSSTPKWSKGKQKEKVNNMVLFDQASYDKLLSEVPKYKLITPSILSDRLRNSTADLVVSKYIASGLSREAVPLAVANYGDNPTKVWGYIKF